MERAADPLVKAKVVGAAGELSSAIRQALLADGAQVVGDTPHRDAEGLNALIFVASAAKVGPIATTSAAEFSDHVGSALHDAFRALQSGVALIRAGGGGGSVVLVAPTAGSHRAFDALRQGLRLMVKSAALELGPEQIRVNVVLPGGKDTPLGQPCTPAHIADAVVFAASPRSKFMTGGDLVVDGGALAL
jgi:NAD(P)-dependent dehydrogenase (short-subunit alcohol dehydrogenase family)